MFFNDKQMPITYKPTKSLRGVYERGSLLSILEMNRILTKISVLENGGFTTETKDWDSYWQPVHELGCRDIQESLVLFTSLGEITSGLVSALPSGSLFAIHISPCWTNCWRVVPDSPMTYRAERSKQL